MLQGIWSLLSHPGRIAGPADLPFLIPAAVIVALLTASFLATVGKRIASQSRIIAVVAGSVIVPAAILALAALFAFMPAHGTTDGTGVLVMVTIVMAICALPVSLCTSLIFVARHRRAA